jgi:hypothetical protein
MKREQEMRHLWCTERKRSLAYENCVAQYRFATVCGKHSCTPATTIMSLPLQIELTPMQS